MIKSTVGHITTIECDIGEALNVEHAKPPLVVYRAVKNKKNENNTGSCTRKMHVMRSLVTSIEESR